MRLSGLRPGATRFGLIYSVRLLKSRESYSLVGWNQT